jgi:hypothetical protein
MPWAITLVEPLYITDPFEGSIADSAQGRMRRRMGKGQERTLRRKFRRPIAMKAVMKATITG